MAKFRRFSVVVVMGAFAAVLTLSGCASSLGTPSVTQVSAKALPVVTAEPAPRACPWGFARAESIPPSDLVEALNGHVPAWLPPGFGLAASYGQEGDSGTLAQGQWSDGQCREVSVGLYDHTLASHDGERVGDWAVIVDGPGCSNDVLGRARCIVYQSTTQGDRVTVQIMGLDRTDADRLVSSIP